MRIVCDTGPVNYLVLIGAVDVLPVLFERVVIPESVRKELDAVRTPAAVRAWIASPPRWLEVCPDPLMATWPAGLGAGERAVIGVAIRNQDWVLMDDQAGRAEAQLRGLTVTGTLGVLAAAHKAELLEFERALERLAETSFYVSARLLARIQELL